MEDWRRDAVIDQVGRSHDDVRRLHERGQLILGAGFAAAGLSLPIISKAPDVGFALSELLFTFAFAWYLNLNAEAASVSEIRDYLSELVNDSSPDNGPQPFKFSELGDVGRGHPSTVLTGVLPVVVLLGFATAGGLSAFGRIHWNDADYTVPRGNAIALWVVVTALCISAFIAAGVAESHYREKIRSKLWGPQPGLESPSLPRRIWQLIVHRDNQGWDRGKVGSRSTADSGASAGMKAGPAAGGFGPAVDHGPEEGSEDGPQGRS